MLVYVPVHGTIDTIAVRVNIRRQIVNTIVRVTIVKQTRKSEGGIFQRFSTSSQPSIKT